MKIRELTLPSNRIEQIPAQQHFVSVSHPPLSHHIPVIKVLAKLPAEPIMTTEALTTTSNEAKDPEHHVIKQNQSYQTI